MSSDCFKIKTRLPSNLRPTTHECVHLVRRGHFRSSEKDGGHVVRSAKAVNLKLHINFMALCVIETELLPIDVLPCGNRDFGHCFAPVTLVLIRWPSYVNLTRLEIYRMSENEFFLRQDFRKLSSDIHIYIYADRRLRGWSVTAQMLLSNFSKP